jgi:hypothetical protein
MVLPQLQAAEDASTYDYTSILKSLVRVYDNPNKVIEAEDKLFALKQGTDSLTAYIAKFERVLYEARGQDWPDVNKISTFRQGLSSHIKGRLLQQLSLPRTYTEFLRIVQQLSGRSAAPLYSDASSTPAKPYVHQRNPSAVDIGEINTITLTAIGQDSSSPPLPSRARSTSPNERQRRRSLGRCVRCNGTDHWVRDCPLEPYKPGKKVTGAAERAA